VFKDLRVRIFNWFAAGRLTLTYEKPKEYNPMSTYTIGGGNLGALTINPSTPQTSQTINIKVTPANGGTIVQVNTQEYSVGELHIIPDGTDFDRELGKIITLSKLKA
jgi:hypothetical protein